MRVIGFLFRPKKRKMKVKGYLSNCCNKFFNNDSDTIYGVSPATDAFSKFDSFKTVPAEKAEVHFCSECYAAKVTQAADNLVYKGKNPEKWTHKMKELAYLFKNGLFSTIQAK